MLEVINFHSMVDVCDGSVRGRLSKSQFPMIAMAIEDECILSI